MAWIPRVTWDMPGNNVEEAGEKPVSVSELKLLDYEMLD